MSSIPKFPLNCLANFRSFPISYFFGDIGFCECYRGLFLGERGWANFVKIINNQLFCQANYKVIVIDKPLEKSHDRIPFEDCLLKVRVIIFQLVPVLLTVYYDLLQSIKRKPLIIA